MSKPGNLTPKQALFVKEYLVDLNGTQAAVRAGYSAKGADVAGARLLGNVRVKEAIQAAMDDRAERLDITADRVLQEIARLSFSDIRKLFTEHGQLRPIHDLPDDVAAAIASIEVVTRRLPGIGDEPPEIEYVHKIKTCDKRGSLELLGKHLKLFSERVEVDFLQSRTDTELAALEREAVAELARAHGLIK